MSKKQKGGVGKSSSKKSAKSKTVPEVGADVETKPLNVQRARVDDILVNTEEFRAVSEAEVDALADSMAELGLFHPITVYYKKSDDESSEPQLTLNSGQHRLAAAKKLGWKDIDVVVVARNKRKNAMRRISENVHRNPLSKIEEGQQILEWIKHRYGDGDGQVAQHNDKGISAAAEEFGKSRRTIKRLLLAGSIKPEAALALKQANLDKNGTVLEAVLGEDLDDQLDKVEQIIKKRKETNREGRRKSGQDKKRQGAAAAKQASETVRSEADSDDWEDEDAVASDEDAPASTQEVLQRAWEVSGVFRKAWATADVDERQRFFDDVLLGYEVTINEDTDEEDA